MTISPLAAGNLAPDFTLLNQHNDPVSLAQFRGQPVLVYFYPKALTPGCTTQACDLRDNLTEFTQHNVAILGISPDLPAKLANFAEKKGLNFTLLSDADHRVAEAFGVWGEKKFMGRTFDGLHRVSFLIDEQGKIARVFQKFKTSTHAQTVLEALTAS